MVHTMEPHPAEAVDKIKALQEQIDELGGRMDALEAQLAALIEAQPAKIQAKLDKDATNED